MSKNNPTADLRPFLKGINWLLLIVFTLMLGGYFAWAKSPGFNMLFKLSSRLLMTGAIYLISRKIIQRGAVASFNWKYEFSPLLYLAYLGLGLMSFLWSSDVGYSSLQWLMDVTGLIFSYYFIICFVMLDKYFPGHSIRLYKILGHSIFMLIGLFVVGFFINPMLFMRMTHEGGEFRLGGFLMNPNELGMLAGVGVGCYIMRLYQKGWRVWIMIQILVLLFAIVLTGSRSTIIGVLIITFYHIHQSSKSWLKYLMYGAVAIALPVVVNTLIIKSNGNGGLTEVMSMTGRLPFWKALVTDALPKEPWLGFGFQRIYYTLYFSGTHTYSASMAHNTFLQALMNLGIIGFVIIIFQFFFTIRAFICTKDKQLKLISGTILIPVIVNSFTEFGIFGETNFGILLYQMLILYLCLRVNPKLTSWEKLLLRKKRPDLIPG